MKKTIAILTAVVCAGSMPASADVVVAGWDTFSGTGAAGAVSAPVTGAGITASFVSTTEQQAWNTVDERGASSDGTWGTFAGPPAADTTVGTADNQNLELPNATTGGTLTFTITNTGTGDVDLNAFHMDAYSFRFRAARTYVLSVTGDVTDGTIYTSSALEINTEGGVPADNDQGDDIDHSLLGLADHTLAPGETADFLLTFSGGTGGGNGGHDLWVDNIAVSGVIPEPATLGMVAAFGGGILFIRRRFMI